MAIPMVGRMTTTQTISTEIGLRSAVAASPLPRPLPVSVPGRAVSVDAPVVRSRPARRQPRTRGQLVTGLLVKVAARRVRAAVAVAMVRAVPALAASALRAAERVVLAVPGRAQVVRVPQAPVVRVRQVLVVHVPVVRAHRDRPVRRGRAVLVPVKAMRRVRVARVTSVNLVALLRTSPVWACWAVAATAAADAVAIEFVT